MRDIKRIGRLLTALQKLWDIFPDMRFWQIINLIVGDKVFQNIRDPFFLEDDVWLLAIENTIKKFTENQ